MNELWIRLQDASSNPVQSAVRTRFKTLSFSTKLPGGFFECSLLFPCDRVTAFDWYDTYLNYRLTVMEADMQVWDGRIEDLQIADDGIKVTARGYWQNSFDVPYNINYEAYTVKDIVKAVLTAACSQISSDQSNIGDPGMTITIGYQDNMYPGNIIEDLGKLGDAGGTPWHIAIWDDKIPYYAARGTAVTWKTNIRDVNNGGALPSRSLNEIWNEVGADYQIAGARQATGLAVNAASKTKYGLTRAKYISAGSATENVAIAIRDTYLLDHADSPQQGNLRINNVRSVATGNENTPTPLWRVRAGDILRMNDLIPAASSASDSMDGLRIFHILETSYDYESNQLTITPDNPAPTLDVLLALANKPTAVRVRDMSSYLSVMA